MKILFLSCSSQFGGAQVILFQLMMKVKEYGNECVLLTFEKGPLSDECEKNNISTYVIPRVNLHSIISPVHLLKFISSAKKIKELLLEVKPDIVYAFTVRTYEFGVLANIFTKVPVIGAVHDPDIKDYFKKKLYIFSANKYFSKLVFVSEAIKVIWVERGINADKTITINNGIDIKKYEEKIVEIDKYNNFFVVGTIARMVKDKGVHVLLKSINILKNKIENLKVVLVGGFHPDRIDSKKYWDDMHEYVLKNDLSEIVEFLGWEKDVASLLNAMDVCVLPSIYPDPFPTVNLEAMCLKKPVIAVNIGGSKEAVLDNETGFIIPPGDENILADKILFLFANPDKRKKMGELGYQRLINNFSLINYADKNIDLLKEVLREKNI